MSMERGNEVEVFALSPAKSVADPQSPDMPKSTPLTNEVPAIKLLNLKGPSPTKKPAQHANKISSPGKTKRGKL